MTDSITPPPELLDKWDNLPLSTQEVFVIAAQWGADQELEAIIKLADGASLPEKDRYFDGVTAASLRAQRRPQPPSLKAQALEQLDGIAAVFQMSHGGNLVCDTIRRALEELPE
jgi:hypothetical protein